MAGPAVRIIEGAGPTLSLTQLERASAKLLISRIRGHEPQVSLNFVQRLLDELIRRRRDEELLQFEVDHIAENLEESAPQVLTVESEPDASADFETLMTADITDSDSIDTTAAASAELELPEEVVLDEDSPLWDMAEGHDEESEIEEKEPSKLRKRGRVQACSRPRHGVIHGELNVWRIVVIAAIAVFLMIAGVVMAGCGLGG